MRSKPLNRELRCKTLISSSNDLTKDLFIKFIDYETIFEARIP